MSANATVTYQIYCDWPNCPYTTQPVGARSVGHARKSAKTWGWTRRRRSVIQPFSGDHTLVDLCPHHSAEVARKEAS